MKIVFIFLIIVLVFSACEKDVAVEIPQKPARLVMNGVLQKDQVIRLTVGKSRHVLEPTNGVFQDYVVKDAVPVVYENNIPIDTLVYQPGEYVYKSIHNRTIQAGNTYTVKVTAPGYTPIEATSTIPSQSEIAEVKRVRDVKVNSNGEHFDEVTVKLNDPAGEKNFYLIQFFQALYYPLDEPAIYCVSTTDKDLEQVGDNADPLSTDNCYDGYRLIMRDNNFNGQQKQLRFYISSSQLDERTDYNGQPSKPLVRVSRITEAHFKYIKSFQAYETSVDNPFAEPANVFSNVVNGYGIFAVRTTAQKTID